MKFQEGGFRYYAASYWQRYCEPTVSFVSLVRGKAEEAAAKGAEFERCDLPSYCEDAECVVESLDAIAEDGEDAELEADLYTAELTAWVASRPDRLAYCDEALSEWGGGFKDTFHLLQLGQYAERQEVLGSVLNSLAGLIG
jgi:hypothetical protein